MCYFWFMPRIQLECLPMAFIFFLSLYVCWCCCFYYCPHSYNSILLGHVFVAFLIVDCLHALDDIRWNNNFISIACAVNLWINNRAIKFSGPTESFLLKRVYSIYIYIYISQVISCIRFSVWLHFFLPFSTVDGSVQVDSDLIFLRRIHTHIYLYEKG